MNPPADHGVRWRLIGFALSATGSLLFALKGILIKLIYVYGIDTTALLAIRMGLSLPVFAGVGLYEWYRRPPADRPDAKSIGLAATVGVLGYHCSSWLDFEGLQTLEAQTERLILFTYPFLVIIFGRMIFGHRLRAHALGGAGLAYAGLAVMFGAEPARLNPSMLTGALFVFGAAATFALYQLFARELIVRCGPALFTAIAMSAASVSLITQFLLTRDFGDLVAPAPAWRLMVALAIFSTVVPTFLMSAGTARIGAQGTAIISTVSPLLTIILAVAILAEPFGWPEAVGTLLVIGGTGLFTLIETRSQRRAR